MTLTRYLRNLVIGSAALTAGAAVMVLANASPASADHWDNDSPHVLAAIQSLRRAVTDSLSSLQDALDDLSPREFRQVRITPPVYRTSDHGNEGSSCAVVNVTNRARRVRVELIDPRRGVVSAGTEGRVAPGGTLFSGTVFGQTIAVCKFTVLNGSRADIRASLIGTAAPGATTDTTLVVPAE